MCAFVDLLCSRLCGKCCAHVISSVCASVRAAITQLEKDFPDHTPSVDEVAVWLSWDQALGLFGKELGLLKVVSLVRNPFCILLSQYHATSCFSSWYLVYLGVATL